MMTLSVLQHVADLETEIHAKLPENYRRFLVEDVGEADACEVRIGADEFASFYGAHVLGERNQTYDVQSASPGFLMIGQDGDLGYFIHTERGSDVIYSQDLGALGILEMDVVAADIYDLAG